MRLAIFLLTNTQTSTASEKLSEFYSTVQNSIQVLLKLVESLKNQLIDKQNQQSFQNAKSF